ncbi:MAG: hypothetical protein J6X49_04370 [Victivallales bacterium]|nr:hypothetical protein [Victivallales bacterium]
MDRHLDPLSFNLVVADASRTDKTICLAVSPSLKAVGVPSRPRLFEVVQKVREINVQRLQMSPRHRFTGKSSHGPSLQADASLALGYIVAMPRMARYLEVSSRIYGIYLKYVSPEDIHVYSVDEVFIDATDYLRMYRLTAREFTMKLIQDVLQTTGITATAGIGTNLYLCKVAMDIVAKHIPADKDGVRIAELDEDGYRRELWTRRPLTDFWRIGHGYAERLAAYGMHTMGDVARMSVYNEELLYRLFGVNAELLIDHAWGWEPCTIAAIKSYRPESHSLSSGQVLQKPYDFGKGRLVTKEMADGLVLELVEKHLVTDQMTITVGYDVANLANKERRHNYAGPVVSDHYGRLLPKEAHGSINLGQWTSSSRIIIDAMTRLYDRVVGRGLLVKRIVVAASHVLDEKTALLKRKPEQLELFTDYKALEKQRVAEQRELERERRQQKAVIAIRRMFGKNAIFKGMDLEEGATARSRNMQIGGHRM